MSSTRTATRRAARASAERAETKVDDMIAALRASGLKLTPQRMAVVRELAADPTHPTAQELFERLRPALPTMSFATVYNTLDALAGAGLCAALALAPGAARFDPNMRAHHHAVCDRCGAVRDVACEDDVGEALAVPPSATEGAAHDGFEVRAVELIYRGLCAVCARDAVQRSAPARGRRPAQA